MTASDPAEARRVEALSHLISGKLDELERTVALTRAGSTISASVLASASRIRRVKAPGTGSRPPSISATVRAIGEVRMAGIRSVRLANRSASAASSASAIAGELSARPR